jgi:putative hemolysin
MQKIELHPLVEKLNPNFSRYPKFIKALVLNILGKILHLSEINKFLEKNIDNYNIQFIDEIFEYINFSFRISNKDITRIPSEGKLIVIANHPIGSLDSLAIIKTISEIRRDVKIVANDTLHYVNNINGLLLPIKLDSKLPQRDNLIQIGKALEREEAVIMFPAGEVSRLKGLKVVDGKWSKGAVYFSKKHGCPILPMHIDAKNSSLFYFISAIYKPLSTLLLVHELFNKKNRTITITIGDPIPAKVFVNSFINYKTQIKLLKKHTYALSKNKKGIYLTEENIIHPISPKLIHKEIIMQKF